MGVVSGSGWNIWVWLLGVVVRRYIDFLILLIPTPLVSVLFCSSIHTFCSFKKCFLYIYIERERESYRLPTKEDHFAYNYHITIMTHTTPFPSPLHIIYDHHHLIIIIFIIIIIIVVVVVNITYIILTIITLVY